MIYDEHKLIHIATPKTGTSCIFKMIHSIPLEINMSDGYIDDRPFHLAQWFKDPQTEECLTELPNIKKRISLGHPLYIFYKKGHESYQEYKNMIEDYPYYKEYKYFTFTRNPYDIMVSNYFYQARGSHEIECVNLPFKKFCWALLKNPGIIDDVWKTQVDYLKNKDGKIEMNFIGRLENFKEDWEKLRELYPTLPVYNPSYRQTNVSKKRIWPNGEIDFREMYDSETQKLVLRYFEEDFDTFHYPASFSVPMVPWRWPYISNYPGFKEPSFKDLQDSLDNGYQ